MNINSNDSQTNKSYHCYRMIFYILLTPILLMTFLFISLSITYGILPINEMKRNAQNFANEFSWFIWWTGLLCTLQLFTASIMLFLNWYGRKTILRSSNIKNSSNLESAQQGDAPEPAINATSASQPSIPPAR